MYSETEENRFLEVTYANGDKEVLYFKDFNSGAMIQNIVDRAKKMAIKEFLDPGRRACACSTCSTPASTSSGRTRTCPTPPTPTTGPASPARRASGSSTSARSSPGQGHRGRPVDRHRQQHRPVPVDRRLPRAPPLRSAGAARRRARADPRPRRPARAVARAPGAVAGGRMSVRRVMGTEVEYGISVPGQPGANPMVTSSQVVNAYGGRPDCPAVGRARWDYEEESPLRDARGFDLRQRATTREALGPTRTSAWPTSSSPTAPGSTSTTPTRSTPRPR